MYCRICRKIKQDEQQVVYQICVECWMQFIARVIRKGWATSVAFPEGIHRPRFEWARREGEGAE